MAAALDPFIPRPDVRERFERSVRAPADLVMKTACGFDLQSLLPIRAIIEIRKRILGGTGEGRRAPIGLVEECRQLGWGPLVEEPRARVFGAVCRPWVGDVTFAPVPRERFAGFAEPDLVKIAWSLEAAEVRPGLTRFAHEVRAAATDDASRRKFKRYWKWARFGIVAIRLLLLPAIRRKAERQD
jgi:hypothetical protein